MLVVLVFSRDGRVSIVQASAWTVKVLDRGCTFLCNRRSVVRLLCPSELHRSDVDAGETV